MSRPGGTGLQSKLLACDHGEARQEKQNKAQTSRLNVYEGQNEDYLFFFLTRAFTARSLPVRVDRAQVGIAGPSLSGKARTPAWPGRRNRQQWQRRFLSGISIQDENLLSFVFVIISCPSSSLPLPLSGASSIAL